VRISTFSTPVVLAAALMAVACASPALAATHAVTAATFVLKRTDVPAGFTAKINYSRQISLSDAVARYGLKQAILIRHGRRDGYESGFSRPFTGKTTPKGFYGVADDVTQFSSVSGAHWFYTHMAKAAYHGASASVPAIGDERIALASQPLKGPRVAQITFRHGDFVVDVTTTFLGKGNPLTKAVHYAQVIDQRLSSH
jgi:hypothetical protein